MAEIIPHKQFYKFRQFYNFRLGHMSYALIGSDSGNLTEKSCEVIPRATCLEPIAKVKI